MPIFTSEMRKISKSCWIAILVCLLFCGCHVRNQVYHHTPNSIYVVPEKLDASHRGSPDSKCNPSAEPCLAFLEFDEMGEMWDPGQVDKAIELIETAQAGAEKHHPPVIIAFVHGWKNNAQQRSDGEGNVVAFESVLNELKRDRFPDFPIVGIYIGWRGELISQRWPVSRQFSYFNREATAIRVPGASMTGALTKIMLASHPNAPDKSDSHLIMVGHSFGGLVLERALTPAMVDYVLRESKSNSSSPNENGNRSRADLVVYVNSAAAASEGKQMIDLLKCENFQWQTPDGDQRPLFVSVSSLGDAATRFALPIGHGLSYLRMSLNGSWRNYDLAEGGCRHQPMASVKSQSSYYLSTTAHTEPLQSHIIAEITKFAVVPDEHTCKLDPKYSALYRTPKGEIRTDQAGCQECTRLLPYGKPFLTTGKQCYQMFVKPGRWNDSAYWAMQMPATIVPDHGGIFNRNFIALLQQFFLTPEQMSDPALRPRSAPARATVSDRTGAPTGKAEPPNQTAPH